MITKSILKVTAVAAVAASATYAHTVYKATRRTDTQRVIRQNTVPDSLRTSKSVNDIVDPRGYSSSFDTRYISISIPPHRRNVLDEELLSKFTKAFFGGYVIRPERYVLQKLRPNLVHFSAMNSQNVPQIWDVEQISESSLSPVSTKVFGAFQVLDVQTHAQAHSSETESHIDIGFGNDQSRFAGVHRFSLLRNFEGAESQDHVILKFSCQVATGSKPNLVASIMQYSGFLHGIYADLLFRESVAEVEKWLHSQD